MGEIAKVGNQRLRIGAEIIERAHSLYGVANPASHQFFEQIDDAGAVAQPQHGFDGGGGHGAIAVGDGLIEQREIVTGRTFAGADDHRQRLRLKADAFLAQDRFEIGRHDLGRDAAQIEALAAAEDRHRHLADFGGGEDELHIGRRLFEGFQQPVEGGGREHVHFVDDIDFVRRRGGRVFDRVDDLADVVDASIGGGVHLDDVDVAAFDDGAAVLTLNAQIERGMRAGAVFIVEGARQNTGGGGFADAAHAGQNEGVVNAVLRKRIAQGLHHGVLTDERREVARTILPGEDKIGRRRGIGTSHFAFLPHRVGKPLLEPLKTA